MSTSEIFTPSFIGGWAAVFAIAGAAGYQYYSKDKATTAKPKAAAPYTAPRKENRAKKQRQAAFSSSAQKAADEEPAAPAVETPATTSSKKKERNEEDDNKAFAAQMAQVKEGKKFNAKSGGEKKRKQKSVKQSLAAEPSEHLKVAEEQPSAPSAPSSTGGVDADDDQSPAASPDAAAVDASGVNDMLEPTPAGPSVLKLTDTDKQQTKPRTAKEPEKQETKKQRQNRRKAEERKLAREEDEKARKVLMEKQRRSAREAAGIPAKDGSQFMAAANGGKNAWNSDNKEEKNESLPVQPLDTFDEVPADATAASVAPAKNPGTENWMSSMPSEEEQMEMLKSEDEWNTVPTKSSKKNKKGQATEMPSAPAREAKPVPEPVTKPSPPAPTNGKAAKPATQSYGSFSALTTKGDDVEEEEEQEWDV